ncbi:RNA polymerase sigma factor [Brevundimonas diminuta]|uniref:RNA polymerase sigma factor n=1 Tax=Brevundimonas diminuta TaxID=293 RepID=UPI0030F9FE44
MIRVLPHEPSLRAWLSSKRGAGIDVDDVVQETYAVLAARETVSDIRHPRAYLFQVAQSVVVRHVRRARIVSIQAAEDLERFDPVADAASPEQTAIDRDELRHLAEMIAAMPGQTRQAFILRRVHGLSQREIAERMRLAESTVEKHIARGLRFLIDRLGHGGKGLPQTSKRAELDIDLLHGRTRNKPKH